MYKVSVKAKNQRGFKLDGISCVLKTDHNMIRASGLLLSTCRIVSKKIEKDFQSAILYTVIYIIGKIRTVM